MAWTFGHKSNTRHNKHITLGIKSSIGRLSQMEEFQLNGATLLEVFTAKLPSPQLSTTFKVLEIRRYFASLNYILHYL